MEKLRINFVDFWPNFLKTDNYFYNLLSTEYDVSIDEDTPDLLFHSFDYSKKQEHKKYDNLKNTKKVYYTGECNLPNFNETDFSFTFDYLDDGRNYRLPLWAMHINWFGIAFNPDRDQSYLHDPNLILGEKILKFPKDKFCSFLSSNPKGLRMSFVPKLNKRKFIHCAGRLYTNTQQVCGRGDQIQKIEYLRDFKFNISFESVSHDGYVTEKIIQPMFTNTIPIYWGSKRVGEDFNKKSFLCYHDFQSEEEFIEKILEVDNNNFLYENIFSEPWFVDNKFPDFVLPKNVLKFFNEKILK